MICALVGLLNGLQQGTIYGLCGILPGKYMGVFNVGVAASAVAPMVLKVILLLAVTEKNDHNRNYKIALIEFGFSALIMLICAYGYSILIKNPFFLFYQNKFKQSQSETEETDTKISIS